MRFGWQGFTFEHPDDWAPANLSGTYREGYARIASPLHSAIQVRWRRGTSMVPEKALDAYLRRLARDSKQRRLPFTCDREMREDGRIEYRWSSDSRGRGCVFCEGDAVFFLEALGRKGDSLQSKLKTALSSFSVCAEGPQLWSLLGLNLSLPAAFRIEKHEFQAGRTRLAFAGRHSSVECTRWGFAEQLLGRHELSDWAKASLDMEGADIEREERGLRLSRRKLVWKMEALVAVQPEQNQIVTVKLVSRLTKEAPSWDWLP